jgi:hypothetical protein
VAKLAKDKGFSGSGCLKHYDQNGLLRSNRSFSRFDLTIDELYKHDTPSEVQVYAPTQSLLQRWLREEKGIHISVEYEWVEGIDDWTFYAYIKKVNNAKVVDDAIKSGFNTYELALEDALVYSLKNLI